MNYLNLRDWLFIQRLDLSFKYNNKVPLLKKYTQVPETVSSPSLKKSLFRSPSMHPILWVLQGLSEKERNCK